MLAENADDDIFNEFENLFAQVTSEISRSSYTDDQKMNIKKVKWIIISELEQVLVQTDQEHDRVPPDATNFR